MVKGEVDTAETHELYIKCIQEIVKLLTQDTYNSHLVSKAERTRFVFM